MGTPIFILDLDGTLINTTDLIEYRQLKALIRGSYKKYITKDMRFENTFAMYKYLEK